MHSSITRASLLIFALGAIAFAAELAVSAAGVQTWRRIVTVALNAKPADWNEVLQKKSWKLMYDGKVVPVEAVSAGANETVVLAYPAASAIPDTMDAIEDGKLTVAFKNSAAKEVKVPRRRPRPSGAALFRGCLNFHLTDDKETADIDITGGVQAGVDAKPEYNWSAKARCSVLGEPRIPWGRLSLSFSSEASQQENADPDAMKAAVTWLKRKSFSGETYGFILNADALSYEFERKVKTEHVIENAEVVKREFLKKNSNLMWTGMGRFVVPPSTLGSLTIGFFGVELGRSVSRTVKADLRDSENQAVRRLHFNADAYKDFYRGPRRIVVLHGHHTARFPFVPEPYVRATENAGKMYLTNKPRHWTLVEMLFPFYDGFNMNIQYKRGSLPPSFEFVNHQVTIGVNLLLKRG
jgi:hypothetical protein